MRPYCVFPVRGGRTTGHESANPRESAIAPDEPDSSVCKGWVAGRRVAGSRPFRMRSPCPGPRPCGPWLGLLGEQGSKQFPRERPEAWRRVWSPGRHRLRFPESARSGARSTARSGRRPGFRCWPAPPPSWSPCAGFARSGAASSRSHFPRLFQLSRIRPATGARLSARQDDTMRGAFRPCPRHPAGREGH